MAPGEGITSRFAATVRAAGTAVAAVEGGTSVTYDELDRRSNQLARFLLRQGAGPGSLVGLHAGRSLASLLAIVATLKIRAGYVPLDPTTPSAYLASIVRDCRADLVFSHGLATADAFQRCYEAASPQPLPDMWYFDALLGLRALLNYPKWLQGYHDAGMRHLELADVGARLEAFVRRALDAAP